MISLKRICLAPLAAPKVASLLAGLTGAEATIFMCHRFAVPDLGVEGHDPEVLRRTLTRLRKEGFDLISLEELFRRIAAGEPLRRAVAFTIDDGYFEHAEVAAPAFAACDCPVTVFAVTGFLDGATWFWWDKLTVIFETTVKPEVCAQLGPRQMRYRLDSPQERSRVGWELKSLCQDVSEADRLRCVEDLSREAEVALPAKPPAQYSPMTWAQARKLEQGGMAFGPHTVTHPILSSAPESQAIFEIGESWRRLQAEVRKPVPVFCYPSGRGRDFGAREVAAVRELGLAGAVTACPGEVNLAAVRSSPSGPFVVPRFSYQGFMDALQCVSGLEAAKARLRGTAA